MPKNLYADINAFTRRFTNSQTLDASDLTEVERVIESGSRRVDEYTRRWFYAVTKSVQFDGNGKSSMRIPDLIAATTIGLDENTDGVFEMTLSAATPDYWLYREGNFDNSLLPSTLISLNVFRGQRFVFIPRPNLMKITGRWGYGEDVERLVPTATLANATTTTMTTTANVDLAIGQTLLLGTEQVYITGSAVASPWTVVRGVNGTTAAAQAAVPIDRYVYVPEVREAALMMAARLWKRRETSYATVIQNPIVGSYETYRTFDPDVSNLLAPYVRLEVH